VYLPPEANAGNRFYGRDVAEFISDGLTGRGLEAGFLDEDWGWQVHGVRPDGLLVEVSIYYNVDETGDDDWALMERERFRQVRLHLLERLSGWATRSGRFTEAIAAALWAVEGGPLRESGYRCLARAHLAEGNVDEAVHHVATYLAELGRSGLPRRLSPAMMELLGSIVTSVPFFIRIEGFIFLKSRHANQRKVVVRHYHSNTSYSHTASTAITYWTQA